MLKIAVTGASGFIGQHVLAELTNHPVRVTAVTRDASNITDIGSDVNVIEMDIAESTADNFEKLGKPDILIHLAWDGLPNYGSPHHVETELPRQFNFLNDLIASGLPALVVSGTCFEYGNQSGALTEKTEPLPDNPYGIAKNTLRHQLEEMKDEHEFSLAWARLFYVYGEHQASNTLFSQLATAVAQKEGEFHMSGGEQLRDYSHISDVARTIVTLATNQADCGVINVCSGIPVSVRNLVERWIRENNWKIELDLGYYPYNDYEPMSFWGDSTKLTTYISDLDVAKKSH